MIPKQKPRRPGRPPDVGEPRTEWVRFRVTPEELEGIQREAQRRRRTMARFARDLALVAAGIETVA